MGNTQPKFGERRWKSLISWRSLKTEPSLYSINSASSSLTGNKFWSKSQRKWKTSGNLYDPFGSSRTLWPVPFIESLFLPEFPIKGKAFEDDFQVRKVIAKGAFGEVFQVKKYDTRETFAMKVLSKAEVLKESAVNQCKEEISIQLLVGNNPFFVKAQHYWQSRKNLFIVSDYIGFGELYTLWRDEGHLSETVTRIYIAELAIAIDFLHNVGVIYRDLKMENVLLDAQGHIKLIDFGLAKWLPRGSRTRTVCGTIQYMAPEILSIEPYTHAVDWWSLGVLMYTLLTGGYPVHGLSDHTAMAESVEGFDYQLSKEFSFPARFVLSKLLCKRPEHRLQNLLLLRMEEFFKDLNFDTVRERLISPRELLAKEKKYLPKPSFYHLTSSLDSATSQEWETYEERFPQRYNFENDNSINDEFEDFVWVSSSQLV